MNTKYLLKLILIENLILFAHLFYVQPDSSISIYLIILIPSVVLINLSIGLLSLLFNVKIAKLFFLLIPLSIFFTLIQFFSFIQYDSINKYKNYSFLIDSKLYELTISNENNHFDILDVSISGVGYGICNGNYSLNNDTILLHNNNVTYKFSDKLFILDNTIYNFQGISQIKLD